MTTKRWIMAAVLTSWLGPSPAGAETPLRSAHHGDALLQVEAWPDDLEALGLDVWTHHATSPSVLVRVTPPQRALLDMSGFHYDVVEPDLGPRVEAEAARLAAAPRPVAGGLDPGYHDEYRDLAAVFSRLDALAAAAPNRVTPVQIGTSIEGRPLVGLRLTNAGGDENKPVIVVVSCQHSREWISVAATMWATEQIVFTPGGSALDLILDEAELVVLPMLNPDGYVHTWGPERFWRKNRRDGVGVDLNRNWSVAWGGMGSSGYPYDENYRGPEPFSEPESLALRDFLEAEPDAVAFLDIHSFGQLVLYPWGFEPIPAPDDELLTGISDDIALAMAEPYATPYLSVQSADLYPAAGNAIDWSYGERGMHAFALELRPGPGMPPGFSLPPAQIVPTGEEVLASILALAEATIEIGPSEPGDSGGPTSTDDGFETTTGDGLDGTGGSSGLATGTDGTDEGPIEPPGGTAGSDGTGTSAGAGDGGTGEGCSCNGGGGPGSAWWSIVLIPWLRRQRRSR